MSEFVDELERAIEQAKADCEYAERSGHQYPRAVAAKALARHGERIRAAVRLAEATSVEQYALYADACIGRSHSAEEYGAAYLAKQAALDAYRAAKEAK